MTKSVKPVDGMSPEIQVEKLDGFLTERRQSSTHMRGIGRWWEGQRETDECSAIRKKKKTISLSLVASWIWYNPPLLNALRRKLREQRLSSVLLWLGGRGSWGERGRFGE